MQSRLSALAPSFVVGSGRGSLALHWPFSFRKSVMVSWKGVKSKRLYAILNAS
nr:MAG TPA: hypothetical protein [Caudoviricetes sp.]